MLRRLSVPAALAGVLGGFALVRLATGAGYKVSGKTVVIAGGSRGLGLELARQFARRGARLALVARDEAELLRARGELETEGVDVEVVRADLGSREEVNAAFERILRYFGGIDVLVNNAGRIEVGPFETMTLEDFEESMRVHFYGPLYTLFASLDALRKSRGRIVNIASIGGKVSVPHLLPYSASKFALVGLSEGLRAELAREGICVTTVCPGLMRTGSPGHAYFKGKHRLEYAWFALSDGLPLLSMGSARAARKIVDACQRGQAELLLGWSAKLAARVNGLAPGLTARTMSLVNRLLPKPDGQGTRTATGEESGGVLPTWLLMLNARAARRNNELQ